MTMTRGLGPPSETDVLLRQLDTRLVLLRANGNHRAADEHDDRSNPIHVHLHAAERLAAVLRRLIRETNGASAADRARVRAAVHYFALPRDGSDQRRVKYPFQDVHVVNELLHELGRDDLMVSEEELLPAEKSAGSRR